MYSLTNRHKANTAIADIIPLDGRETQTPPSYIRNIYDCRLIAVRERWVGSATPLLGYASTTHRRSGNAMFFFSILRRNVRMSVCMTIVRNGGEPFTGQAVWSGPQRSNVLRCTAQVYVFTFFLEVINGIASSL